MQLSQSTHRQSLIEILAEDIRKKRNDESLPFATAAARVLLQWLGYELDDVTFIDGQDRGIDAWLATESGLDIFQIKTHNLTEDDLLDLSTFDGRGIHDLQRAKIFLTNDQ